MKTFELNPVPRILEIIFPGETLKIYTGADTAVLTI